jgi:hypothetical protein
MRTLLTVIALSIVAGAVCAQPAGDGIKALEDCFGLTRAADAICDRMGNAAGERLDCLDKARKAQLHCIEQVRAGLFAAPAPPPPGIDPPATGAMPLPPERPTAPPPPEKAAPPVPAENPIAAVPPDLPAVPSTPEKPAGPAAPLERPVVTAPPEPQPTTVAPTEKPVARVPPDTPNAVPALPAGPTAAKSSVKAADGPAASPDTGWVVSETTSPVDYSPLITAVTRLHDGPQDAPNALAIRCRGLRTELLVRTDGTWRATRGGDIAVGYQVDDQPAIRSWWSVSADAKSAGYQDDAIGLLRSLPEAGRLKIAVLDAAGSGHEATFQLAGLDAVRRKIAAACKWAPATDKTSSGRR